MAKAYYTDSIKIIDIPAYLPQEKIKYEITFSKGYSPTKGDLAQYVTIAPLEINTNQVIVTLSLKVENVEVRRVRLNISEQVQIRNISLKSTVSQTCEQPNTICNFQLKVNIYSIDRVSHKANLLSLSDIEKLAQKEGKQMGYFIHRLSGYVSTTSKEIINLINNPQNIKNKYVKKAMEIFKRLSMQYTQYPKLIYRDLMKELFEYFLKGSSDPDTVIEEISHIFGSKVNNSIPELKAFYHVYEALIRKNESDAGYDKIQHFSYNVGKQYSSTKIGTEMAQYGGEVVDLAKGIKNLSDVWEDSLADMEANDFGQAYGWELYKRYHPVRAAIRSLD